MNRVPGKKTSVRSSKGVWILFLYVSGTSYRSVKAFENLKRICEEHLKDKCQIKVIDILKTPLAAKKDQIVAIPTLVRMSPLPHARVIGDLSNTENVLASFDMPHLI